MGKEGGEGEGMGVGEGEGEEGKGREGRIRGGRMQMKKRVERCTCKCSIQGDTHFLRSTPGAAAVI